MLVEHAIHERQPMTQTFTKLFNSITASTIWCEPAGTRLVWITMLAMADQEGKVYASMPGLAHLARVSETECQIALDTLLGPDRHSRRKEHEGRRIAELPESGGWQLLNYKHYRELKNKESVKESKREYMRRVRAKARPQNVTIQADQVTVNTPNTKATKVE